MPLLRGIICAYHPAILGSNPKQSINAFSFNVKLLLYLSLHCEKYENKQKEPGLAQDLGNFSALIVRKVFD